MADDTRETEHWSYGGYLTMDTAEKTVFRRKRPLIAQLLKFSISMQKKYREHGILNDTMFQDILPEQSDHGQMMKYLEQVMKTPGLEAPFAAVQQVLREEGSSWVADEMTVDLLAERGELDIDEYIEREAHMIVHKCFGQSKRISEKDKADIGYIVALRYQAAKEATQSQLDVAIAERDEAQAFKWAENGKLKAIAEKIQSYLKLHKIRLNEHVNPASASDGSRPDADPDHKRRDYMALMEDSVDQILDVLARVIFEREGHMAEKKRCLVILGLDSIKTQISLDVAIENALRDAANDLEKFRREIDTSDRLNKELDSQLLNSKVARENDLAAKDRHILYLESQLKLSKAKSGDLEAELRRLRAKLAEAENVIKKINKRSETLTKTRRLGYYQPGWVEQTYKDHGIDPNDVEEGPALLEFKDGDPASTVKESQELPSSEQKSESKAEPQSKEKKIESKNEPKFSTRQNKPTGGAKNAPARRSVKKSRSGGDLAQKSGGGTRLNDNNKSVKY